MNKLKIIKLVLVSSLLLFGPIIGYLASYNHFVKGKDYNLGYKLQRMVFINHNYNKSYENFAKVQYRDASGLFKEYLEESVRLNACVDFFQILNQTEQAFIHQIKQKDYEDQTIKLLDENKDKDLIFQYKMAIKMIYSSQKIGYSIVLLKECVEISKYKIKKS